MEEEPLELIRPRKGDVLRFLSVDIVERQGVPNPGKVPADLMMPACLDRHLHKGGRGKLFQNSKATAGGYQAAAGAPCGQWRLDLSARRKCPKDNGSVRFHPTAEICIEHRLKHGLGAREHHNARGLKIQTIERVQFPHLLLEKIEERQAVLRPGSFHRQLLRTLLNSEEMLITKQDTINMDAHVGSVAKMG